MSLAKPMNQVLGALKNVIRSLASKAGYEVRKAPVTPYISLPVFHLAVRYLMALKGEDIGFVQVGANDGRFGDPLRDYILEHPWHGILVEPQPDVFARLRANYAALADRLVFENCAIASDSSSVTVFRATPESVEDPEYASTVASMKPNVTARQLGVGVQQLEPLNVPCMSLDALAAKHRLVGFDLLQIDTEGYDLQVLRTLDLMQIQPAIIQFEHGHFSPRDIDAAVQHLDNYGYMTYYGGHQGDTVALSGEIFQLR